MRADMQLLVCTTGKPCASSGVPQTSQSEVPHVGGQVVVLPHEWQLLWRQVLIALNCIVVIPFAFFVMLSKEACRAAPATSLSEFSEFTVGVLAECCMHRKYRFQCGLGGCDAFKGPHDRQLANWQMSGRSNVDAISSGEMACSSALYLLMHDVRGWLRSSTKDGLTAARQARYQVGTGCSNACRLSACGMCMSTCMCMQMQAHLVGQHPKLTSSL